MSETEKIGCDFVETTIRQLCTNPDAVSCESNVDEKGVLLTVYVDHADIGRIVGKKGVTAEALRLLLRCLGSKNNARYSLKIFAR